VRTANATCAPLASMRFRVRVPARIGKELRARSSPRTGFAARREAALAALPTSSWPNG
jgi:hypothetical protein